MPSMNHPSGGTIPEDHLRLALRAPAAEERIQQAEEGLAFPDDEIAPDTRVLLLRQIFMGQLELHRFRGAIETAELMCLVGPLKDVALHDKARAQQAVGEIDAAIGSARLAARNAPPDRRSFMLWSLATLQHFHGDIEGALATIDKALLGAVNDRPLLKAHAAYICLENDEAVEDLAELRTDLAQAKCGEGYGQYILGMIAYHLEDQRAAIMHLRTFLRRNARLDPAKALTLREELRRARLTLAELDSD